MIPGKRIKTKKKRGKINGCANRWGKKGGAFGGKKRGTGSEGEDENGWSSKEL